MEGGKRTAENLLWESKKILHFENDKFDFIFSVDFAGQANAANSGICCRTDDVALVARNWILPFYGLWVRRVVIFNFLFLYK